MSSDACQSCGHSRKMHRRGGTSCRALLCRCMKYVPAAETRGRKKKGKDG